jgi:hypothetical protein
VEAHWRGDVEFTATEYGAVLLDLRRGQYWQLSRTAAEIVRALRDGLGRDGAVQALMTSFNVDDVRARHDVATFVDKLESAGLVVREHVRPA